MASGDGSRGGDARAIRSCSHAIELASRRWRAAPPRRSTTWLDRAAAASSGSPTRTGLDASKVRRPPRRPSWRRRAGNARFLERFSPERRATSTSSASRRVAFLSTTASRWNVARAVGERQRRLRLMASTRAAASSRRRDARRRSAAGLGSRTDREREREREREIAPQARDGQKTHNRRRVLGAADAEPRLARRGARRRPKADWTPETIEILWEAPPDRCRPRRAALRHEWPPRRDRETCAAALERDTCARRLCHGRVAIAGSHRPQGARRRL